MSAAPTPTIDIVVNGARVRLPGQTPGSDPGQTIRTTAATTVLSALLNAGTVAVRRSVNGSDRGPLCGMGICHECRVTIDGVPHQRGCLVLAKQGMVITLETNRNA